MDHDTNSDMVQDIKEVNDVSDDKTGENASIEQDEIDDELNTNEIKRIKFLSEAFLWAIMNPCDCNP